MTHRVFISLFLQWYVEYILHIIVFFLKERFALLQPLIIAYTPQSSNIIALMHKIKKENNDESNMIIDFNAKSAAKTTKRARCSNCPYSNIANKQSTRCS